MSMKVERSSLDQVKNRFAMNKKKLEEKQRDYDLEERVAELREEEEKAREYRKEKRKEKKRKLQKRRMMRYCHCHFHTCPLMTPCLVLCTPSCDSFFCIQIF